MKNFGGLALKKIANLYILALSPTPLKKFMLSPTALKNVKRCRRQRKNFLTLQAVVLKKFKRCRPQQFKTGFFRLSS
jgi:hypothetical protein